MHAAAYPGTAMQLTQNPLLQAADDDGHNAELFGFSRDSHV